jgi:hypothetical protein
VLLITKINLRKLLREAYVDAVRSQQSQRYLAVGKHDHGAKRIKAHHGKRRKNESVGEEMLQPRDAMKYL